VTPERYRRRPREVTAVQFTGDNALDLCRWAKPDFDADQDYELNEAAISWRQGTDSLSVAVLDGYSQLDEEMADVGDWILRDDAGNYSVLTDADFGERYEALP
jgi:hypothetical protein